MHFDDRVVDAVFERTLCPSYFCHHSAASLHILKEHMYYSLLLLLTPIWIGMHSVFSPKIDEEQKDFLDL